MYSQPYGDEQQLNLNWIINEIINLHKQLDPDYETPSFTQVYPYSNLNRLNLDWILSELKALKELAPTPVPTELDIQAVAEALVALPFDSNTSYQIYDFISRDGEIWRATEAIAAGGVWDETKWFKTKLGTDLAVLERWINTINNSLTAEIQARQDADTALQNTIDDLTSADISDDSDAGGATVKASLNALKSSLNTINFANVQTVNTAGTDLNAYSNGGIFYFPTSSEPSNIPTGSSNFGFLIVIRGSSIARIAQLWMTTAGSDYKIYYRTNPYSSLTWTNWMQTASIDDISARFTAKEIPVTTESTLPTGITAIGGVTVVQAGNVVTVSIAATRDSNSLNNYTTIATGLPIPLIQPKSGSSTIPFGILGVNGTSAPTGRGLYCTVDDATGELKVARGADAVQYMGTFSYLTNDFSKL